MVLAELYCFPLQVCFWQQVLHNHDSATAFDNMRLVELTRVDGLSFALDQTAVKDSWQHYAGEDLHSHLGQQQHSHSFGIASITLSIDDISMNLSTLQMFSTAA